jgi:hypothetical protein
VWLRGTTDGAGVSNLHDRDTKSAKGANEMNTTRQDHREHKTETPRNSPEQRNGCFAAGEADPAKYPQDLEVGRFSTGQDESEPIERGSFGDGQETNPKATDPDEGFAEHDR